MSCEICEDRVVDNKSNICDSCRWNQSYSIQSNSHRNTTGNLPAKKIAEPSSPTKQK
jgi:hypothetical protein